MKFIDILTADSKEIWDACASERFLKEMGEGTLNRSKFLDYIVQDSLYLRDYLKVFAYAITKSDTLKEMQLYYSLLGYVNDGENLTRLEYLKELNITDADVDKMEKRAQCRAYCDFLINVSKNGSVEDILMAMLPCMLGYGYVFEKLKLQYPQITKGYFAPLVTDYTTQGYRDSCAFWSDYTEKRCKGFDADRKNELLKIFRTASLHELYFWQMAGEDK